MEKILKMRPFSYRFIRYVDREHLRNRGFPLESVSEEEETVKTILPALPEEVEEEDYVPPWVSKYVSNPKAKPVSLEEMRKILSKVKSSLSDAIIEERHGKESR